MARRVVCCETAIRLKLEAKRKWLTPLKTSLIDPSATSLDVCRLVAIGGEADIERTLPKDLAPDPCVLQVLRASISG